MKHFTFSNTASLTLGFTLSCLIALWQPAQAQSNSVDQSVANAQAAIKKRDWASAEGILTPLSQSQPNNPFVFYELAQVYENTNRTDAAKQIYQGIASMPDAAQRQYAVVVRSASGSYMTSLVGLAQARLSGLNAVSAARPAVVVQAPVPAAVAQPMASTPAAQPVAPAAHIATTEVTAAMQNWARAWANKDTNAYFASYVAGYKGDKANAAAWKKFRTNYINSKKSISLDFADMQVSSMGVDKAQMNFKQSYTSNSFKDVTNKTMNWVKQGNVWLIEREAAK